MTVEAAVPATAPVMIAWKAYGLSEEYANTKRWAVEPQHTDGSLWAAFYAGFYAAAVSAAADAPMPSPDQPLPEEFAVRVAKLIRDNRSITSPRGLADLILALPELRALRLPGGGTNYPVIPDGWVMVPREPTPHMQGAAELAFLKAKGWASHLAVPKIYAAILSATPAHVSSGIAGEGGEDE